MAGSFFFYDLETSGFNPRTARIMQFAGQRTDMNLRPVGDPVNVLIKLAPDTLPDPGAVLVTGITPQMTLERGVTEATFLRQFYETIAVDDTVFVGYNSISFDDEFMRHLLYRNFYDAYRWQWDNGCSRWDMLHVVRMTRALRPDGITWPFTPDGKPSNKLELLTSVNGLNHENAHDALEDVQATIALARLIADKQPKLFRFLLDMRDKKKIAGLVESAMPFVYTPTAEQATVAINLGSLASGQGAMVYDLRVNPETVRELPISELVKRLRWHPRDDITPHLPISDLRYNRCPAVAPLGVLDKRSQDRLGLKLDELMAHRQQLTDQPDLVARLMEAMTVIERGRPRASELVIDEQVVDGQLYDRFVGDDDQRRMALIRATPPAELAATSVQFTDQRLAALLPLYKARNFPEALTADEREWWERFRIRRLLHGSEASQFARYNERLAALAKAPKLSNEARYLLEELRLYGESIMPAMS